MSIGNRIKQRRENLNISQDELAKKLGYKSRTSIAKIETDSRNLTQSKIKAIADALDCTPSYIMGWEEEENLPANLEPVEAMKKLPRVGNIACGTPILAQQNVEDYTDTPGHINADFTLSCKGNSMINSGIYDGDIAYIRQQPIVENGEIAAVLVDSEEATLKRFYKHNDMIILAPDNPTIKPLTFIGDEMRKVRIIGRVVAVIHYP